MRLRAKLASVVFLTLLMYYIMTILMHRYLLLPSFLALESEQVRREMQRCTAALDRELHYLSLLCFDWSAWDDTYEYVAHPNNAFERANLVMTTFTENNINLLFIFDAEGRRVWGQVYDLETEKEMELAYFSEEHWAVNHPLLRARERQQVVTGVLITHRGPLLLAARPILPSMEDGPARGTMIMGRFLNAALIDELRKQTGVPLEVQPYRADDALPRAFVVGASRGDVEVTPLSSSVVEASTIYPDIFRKPGLILKAALPREILARGQRVLLTNNIGAVVCGLAVLILLLFVLRLLITDPLQRLTSHLKAIRRGARLSPAPASNRTDEIGTLQREFNRMVRTLHQDAQQKEEMEDALRDREARMSAILRSAPDGIFTLSEEGRIQSSNEAAAAMLGYTTDELQGLSFLDLFPHYARKSLHEAFVRFVETRPGDALPARELTARQKNGEKIPLHVRMSLTVTNGSQIVTCIARNISSMKASDRRLARSRHLASVGEMAAAIAHQIRNPLAGISGACQVLLAQNLSLDEIRPVLHQILGLVRRVEEAVQQLLRYAAQHRVQFQQYRALPLLRDYTDQTLSEKHAANIHVTYAGDDEAIIVVDTLLFQQVVWNLVSNACDAMPSGGNLEWFVSEKNDAISILLRDSGAGIGQQKGESLFIPFLSTKVYGSGLGLTICRRIMESHGGGISLNGRDGGGVEVELRFPKGAEE